MRLYLEFVHSDVVGSSELYRGNASKHANLHPHHSSKSHALNFPQLALDDRQEAQASQNEWMDNDIYIETK